MLYGFATVSLNGCSAIVGLNFISKTTAKLNDFFELLRNCLNIIDRKC